MRTAPTLQIVQIANRHAPFPVAGYGGIERVVSVLHDALPTLVSIGVPGSSGERVVVSREATVESLIETAAAFAGEADMVLVHHPEMVEPAAAVFGEQRVAEMLHVPVEDTERFCESRHLVIGVSHDQVADVRVIRPDTQVCWHATPETEVGDGTGGYVAWVGRFMPEKGPVEAIRAARRAGVALKLAGLATGGGEHAYFDTQVRPLLGGEIEWVGPVKTTERDDLLRGAAALLVPTRWREAFGLTVIEAAMVGTPVLGYPVGATRELVETGIGAICHGETELADAVAGAMRSTFDRRAIAETARRLFVPSIQAAKLRDTLGRWAQMSDAM